MTKWLVFLAGLALVLGIALAVSYVQQDALSAPAKVTQAAPFVATRQFAPTLVMFEAGEEEVHRWVPSSLVANVGDTVILRVRNADVDCAEEPLHGFGLAAFNVDVPEIPAGGEKVITLQASKPGVYSFVCAGEGCAEDHGEQAGQLVILESGGLD